MRKVAIALLLAYPAIAVAEVSDKVPTTIGLIGEAVVLGTVAFVVASRNWALSLVGAVFTAFEIWSFFDSADIRGAILRENGESYFLVMAAAVMFVAAATIWGGVRGWRKRDV